LEESAVQEATKEHIEGLLSEARSRCDTVRANLNVRDAAQAELDTLYDGAFAGPTPEFPHEDLVEETADIALKQYHDARVSLENDRNALKPLAIAGREFKRTLESIEYALNLSSQYGMGGRGVLKDMMRNSEIDDADARLQTALDSFNDARQQSDRIPTLPALSFRLGNLDAYFETRDLFGGPTIRQKLKRVDAEIRTVVGAYAQIFEDTRLRIVNETSAVAIKQQTSHRARQALQECRQAIVQHAARNAVPNRR
jgi:hypothetical protein